MIGACLAALDGLVDGRLLPDAPELELLSALEDELAVRLVGPGVAATPEAIRLAAPARTALSALQAFFDDAERLLGQRPARQALALVHTDAAPEVADGSGRPSSGSSSVHLGASRARGPYCRGL